MYKIAKRYYERGIYDKNDVAKFVMAGKITTEEFRVIAGETVTDSESEE